MLKQDEIDIQKAQADAMQSEIQSDEVSDFFVQEHIGVVESIASGLVAGGKVPSSIEFNDLVSWGVEGLIKAKRNYKEGKGSQFKTYAFYRIKGEMLDRIRSEWQYRNPGDYDQYRKKLQQRVADLAYEQSKHGDSSGSVSQNVNSLLEGATMVYMLSSDSIEIASDKPGMKNPEVEQIDETDTVLWEEIQRLEGDERQVIELFYLKGLRQVEIADKLNYSRSKVCRIHMSVLSKLRNRLQRRYDEE